VAIQQVAAEALAAVQRARSLFGAAPQPPPTGAHLDTAAGSLAGAGHVAAVLSGELVDRHHEFVGEATRVLTRDSRTDAALSERLDAAASATELGGRRLDAVVAQTRALAQEAVAAQTPAAQRAVAQALRDQVAQAQSVVTTTQQQAGGIAGKIRALDYASRGRVQAAGFGDLPTDRPPDPPHGKDPRYWIDVTRIIHVPEGQMAPYGATQIGPGLWYPVDDGGPFSGPPAAKFPLDVSSLTRLPPGQPGPYGTTELAPGVFAPDPRRTYSPDPSWPPPRMPIDVRDVLHVPEGQLAPPDYVEYLPSWWAPRLPSGPR